MKPEYVIAGGRFGWVIERRLELRMNACLDTTTVRFADGSEQTFDSSQVKPFCPKEAGCMTGAQALIQMIQFKKKVRRIDWGPYSYLTYNGTHVIDSISGTRKLSDFAWETGHWEIYCETCGFAQLFDFLEKAGPGAYATTDTHPGHFKLSRSGEHLLFSDGITVVITKALAKAIYKIHSGDEKQ